MSINILDVARGFLTPEQITKSSSFFAETENGINKALTGILPAILSGFITKAGSGPDAANDIFDIVRTEHNAGTANNIRNFFNDGGLLNKGLSLVQALFGDKLGSLMASISSFADIKISSAGSLFSIAGPLVASAIGRQVADDNLNADSMTSLLNGQKTNILNMLPAGLSGIANLLGLSKIGDTFQNGRTQLAETADHTKSLISPLIWILLLLLAALALWYFVVKRSEG